MKIGLPSDSKDLYSYLAPSFERCSYFIIVNSIRPYEAIYLINDAQTAARYVEIQITQLIHEQGLNIIIYSKINSETFNYLQALGIRFYLGIDENLKRNVDAFLGGRLVETKFAVNSSGCGLELHESLV